MPTPAERIHRWISTAPYNVPEHSLIIEASKSATKAHKYSLDGEGLVKEWNNEIQKESVQSYFGTAANASAHSFMVLLLLLTK